MLYWIVFLGAGIGGALRHGVNVWAARVFGYGFPFGTLIVNIIGSFVMGLLVGFFAYRAGLVPQHMRLFLTTGVLGGFTTFSSLGYETFQLVRSGQIAAAAVSVAVQLVVGLAAVWLGYGLGSGGRAALPPIVSPASTMRKSTCSASPSPARATDRACRCGPPRPR